MDVIGHRGQMEMDGEAENTTGSVVAALAAGADGVEVDVRVTADGVAICAHDPDLRRLTGISADVSSLTYADMRAVPLPGGGRFARLTDVAHVVRGAGELVAEIKHEPGTCPSRQVAGVLEALSVARLGDDLVVSSFSAAVLAILRVQAPGVRRALVTSAGVSAAAGLNEVLAWGHHELHAHVGAVLDHPHIEDRAREHGRRLLCWDVNRACDARLLMAAGVSGVITDDPGAMISALRTSRVAAVAGALT